MRIVELFSGIGSQAKAFEKMQVEHSILNTCEWDIHAIVAYDLIHNNSGLHPRAQNLNKQQLVDLLDNFTLSIDGKTPMPYKSLRCLHEDTLRLIYSAILKTNNFVNIQDLNGVDLPANLDLLTYSFPCQDLSNVGAFHGYNRGIDRDANNRSGMLWEVERLLEERSNLDLDLPQFLLLENVPALLSQRHRENFEEWKRVLDGLGYYNHVYRLNAIDFGLPQNRDRLLMLSILTNDENELNQQLEQFFQNHNIQDPEYRMGLNIDNLILEEALKIDYTNETYYYEALESQPNDTPSRRHIWEDNTQITDVQGNIIADKVATLTTKQDRHPNSGNLYVDFKNGRSHFRYLTPRECLILMGFEEQDYEKIIQNNVQKKLNGMLFTRDKILRLAGNSIAVNVLEAVFTQLMLIRRDILGIGQE
jgi:DNA (cytosine-5)-methyltransferase 1